MTYRITAELKSDLPEYVPQNYALDLSSIRYGIDDPAERQQVYDKLAEQDPKPEILDEGGLDSEETLDRATKLLLRDQTDLVRVYDESDAEIMIGTFRFEFGLIKWTALRGLRPIPLSDVIERRVMDGLTPPA